MNVALAAILASLTAAAGPTTLVFCAPGYPGTTAEAQPAMDAFARAVARAAGQAEGSLAAVYHETEQGGMERLGQPDAGLAILPLPLYLEKERELRLKPLAQVIAKGGAAAEPWTLLAKKGRVDRPAAMANWQVVSVAGYSTAFLRGPVLGSFGGLPPNARVVFTGAILSALRRAAAGEDVAVILDRAQAASLATLPFADELQAVATSAPLPVAVVAAVGNRLPAVRARALAAAMAKLPGDPSGAEALEAIRLAGFAPADEKAIAGARAAFDGARK